MHLIREVAKCLAPPGKQLLVYKRKAILSVAAALVMAPLTFGASVTWYLNNVTFNDDATASGSFAWDADSQTLSNWNISTTAGVLPSFTYTPADSSGGNYFQVSGYQNEFLFMVNGSTRQLRMTPIAALSDAGGIVDVDLNTWGGGAGSLECNNCNPYRKIVSGSFQTTAVSSVPEPGSLGLLGLSLAAFGIIRAKLANRFTRKDETKSA